MSLRSPMPLDSMAFLHRAGGSAAAPVSDEYLQQLEARWRETGDAPDEARLLLERMRAGVLPRSRLELAAFLGHEAARMALPASPGVDAEEPTRLAAELWPWGKEACVAAAVAGAHAVSALGLGGRDERPRQAIEAAAAWVHCPCEAHVAAARRAADAALQAAGIAQPNAHSPAERYPALAAHHAAAAAAAWPLPVSTKHAHRAIKYAEEAALATGAMNRSDLTAIICQALVLWALGSEHAPADLDQELT